VYLTNRSTYSGELLSVSDSGFVVLVGERVAVARFGRVDHLLFNGFSCGVFPSGNCSQPRAIEEARAVSRFPFGIPASAFRTLLERGKQTVPDSLQTRSP
jgi:hypothetical protein